MNVSMPIAAVMLDLGFPAATVKAVPILARTAELLGAHLAEEQREPIGFHGRRGRGSDRVRAMSDAAAFEEQLAYLLERSPFYREKLAGHPQVALEEIAALPLTEKPEIRATVTPERTRSARTCARRATRSCASTRPAAPPERRATSR